MTSIEDLISGLENILDDTTIPKNVRQKINSIIEFLKDNTEEDLRLKKDKCLAILETVNEDPNLPQFLRMQLFNISSLFESLE
tara:strand:+ start:484 stop:732 length:249 start_codon:yes stop_codon:yes gene_type:complete